MRVVVGIGFDEFHISLVIPSNSDVLGVAVVCEEVDGN